MKLLAHTLSILVSLVLPLLKCYRSTHFDFIPAKAESSCDTKGSAPTAPSGGEGDGTPEVAHKQEDKSEELNQPDVDQVSKAERKEEPTEPSS